MSRELYYETYPEGVPEILQNDWGLTFNNEADKEIAINIFEWKFGPQEDFADMKIDSWQDGSRVKFTKGFFDGKLSFSLDKDKVSIVKLMIIIIRFAIGVPSKAHYIGTGLSMVDFFHSASNVYILNDGVQRCVFLKTIEMSNNKPNVSVDKSTLYQLCCEDKSCPYLEIFECTGYKEHACIVTHDVIDEALTKLEEKKVIRIVNSEVYIR